jgi:hypothetical protein
MYLHSGYQVQPINLPVLLYLYTKSFPHSGQALPTISITFSAFSPAFSRSFFRLHSQKFESIV